MNENGNPIFEAIAVLIYDARKDALEPVEKEDLAAYEDIFLRKLNEAEIEVPPLGEIVLVEEDEHDWKCCLDCAYGYYVEDEFDDR